MGATMKITIELNQELFDNLKTIETDQIEREGSCNFDDLIKWFLMKGVAEYDPEDVGG